MLSTGDRHLAECANALMFDITPPSPKTRRANSKPARWNMPLSDEPLVYFIQSDAGPIKIGISRCPEARCHEISLLSPVPLKVVATCRGGEKKEKQYHKRFAAHRLHGEWFSPSESLEAEIARLQKLT